MGVGRKMTSRNINPVISEIVWWSFLVSSYLVLATGSVLAIYSSYSSQQTSRALTTQFGGTIFIVSSCLLLATHIFLILRGETVFLGRGKGMGSFLKSYLIQTPKWLTLVHVLVALGGIALISFPIVFTSKSGSQDARESSLALSAVGVALLVSTYGAISLLGYRAKRKSESASDPRGLSAS
jgi:hypothetical protein